MIEYEDAEYAIILFKKTVMGNLRERLVTFSKNVLISWLFVFNQFRVQSCSEETSHHPHPVPYFTPNFIYLFSVFNMPLI